MKQKKERIPLVPVAAGDKEEGVFLLPLLFDLVWLGRRKKNVLLFFVLWRTKICFGLFFSLFSFFSPSIFLARSLP